VVSSLQKSNGPLYVSHRSSAYTDRQRKYLKALEDVILQYTYPRIDAEVSKHRNHLLKAPFCVHPGTGELA
jgi:DNA primase catalytic subunit